MGHEGALGTWTSPELADGDVCATALAGCISRDAACSPLGGKQDQP